MEWLHKDGINMSSTKYDVKSSMMMALIMLSIFMLTVPRISAMHLIYLG